MLAFQLEHPEAPANGRGPGRIELSTLDIPVHSPDAAALVIPPTPLLLAAVGSSGFSCDGVGAVLSDSLWLHFRSSVVQFDIDLPRIVANALASCEEPDGTVAVQVRFPPVDPRVTNSPLLPAWTGRIDAASVRSAFSN
jgi:hypothetical protein